MSQQVIERFFGAIERGDIETVRDIYAPHVVIWHNYDRRETNLEENLTTLRSLVSRTTGRYYENRRLQVFEGGLVQQHDLRCVFPGGREATFPVAIVFQLEHGRITRLDEYFDSADLTVFANY